MVGSMWSVYYRVGRCGWVVREACGGFWVVVWRRVWVVAFCGRRSWSWFCMVRGVVGGGKEFDKRVWRGFVFGVVVLGSFVGVRRRVRD